MVFNLSSFVHVAKKFNLCKIQTYQNTNLRRLTYAPLATMHIKSNTSQLFVC